jgi:DnaJ family protein B protein 4
MSVNYYDTLEIERDANHEAISMAFRRLSLKYNPAKNPTNQASNAVRFASICEAWEVLSNPKLKGIFDKYGEYGLKKESYDEKGQKIGGYIFLGNSDDIFDAYFEDELALDRDRYEYSGEDIFGSLLGDAHGAKRKPKPAAPKNVEVNLKCTLAEFYNGSLKIVHYKRDKIHPDGRSITKVDEELQVEIQPGMDVKNVLTFPGQGNEQYQNTRSNLVIKLSLDESLQTNYVRSGNNLIYTHSMSLKDALKSAPVSLTTLDNRIINLNID